MGTEWLQAFALCLLGGQREPLGLGETGFLALSVQRQESYFEITASA